MAWKFLTYHQLVAAHLLSISHKPNLVEDLKNYRTQVCMKRNRIKLKYLFLLSSQFPVLLSFLYQIPFQSPNSVTVSSILFTLWGVLIWVNCRITILTTCRFFFLIGTPLIYNIHVLRQLLNYSFTSYTVMSFYSYPYCQMAPNLCLNNL